MFINTKKAFKIVSAEGKTFSAPAGFIGEVETWVESHWYFKALCKDGTITAIVSSKAPKAETIETESVNAYGKKHKNQNRNEVAETSEE